MTKETSSIVRYLLAGLLLIALLPLPYGYYMFLRVIVFFGFGYFFLGFRKKCEEKKKQMPMWVWIVGGYALLFNPFIPAHMMRTVWAIFNIAGAYLIYKTIEWEKSL